MIGRYIKFFLVTLVFWGCSDASKFSSSKPTQAASNATQESGIPLPQTDNAETPNVPPPSEPVEIKPVQGKKTIEFVAKPALESQSVEANFVVEPSEQIKSLTYILDNGAQQTISGAKINAFAYYGDHSIEVTATFLDGTTSDKLTYQWKVLASGFVLRNDARQSGNEFILTPSAGSKVGMIITENRITFKSVYIQFSYRISELSRNNGAKNPGDGFAFGITETNRNSLNPGLGESLGFFGTGGFGVEFDSFTNMGEPSFPHIALVRDGAGHVSTPVTWFGSNQWIEESWRKAQICVHGGMFTVKDNGRPILTNVAMPAFPTNRMLNAHVFLSAATGAAWEKHSIKDLSISYSADSTNGICQ